MDIHKYRYGFVSALISAFLFGVSTPLSKLLLHEVRPTVLAGCLYLGAGIGLCPFLLSAIFKKIKGSSNPESHLKGKDCVVLSSTILCGGIMAPIALNFGLTVTHASVTSLLLNFEGIFTTIFAAFPFKESVAKRIWIAAIFMFIASILLTYLPFEDRWTMQWGSILVIFACSMWALDSNLTRKLSHYNPLPIVSIKGLIAGCINLCIAYILGDHVPAPKYFVVVLLVGFLSYGMSLVFFIYALRHLGASRTSIYFGIGPFLGAVISIAFLHEPVTFQIFLAFVFASIATYLTFTEYNRHRDLSS